MTSLLRRESPYDTHPGVVINRTKFDACTFSRFGGVETHRQIHTKTHRQNCFIDDEDRLVPAKQIMDAAFPCDYNRPVL